jgi:hypothetical protein
LRREATPAAAMIFCNRSSAICTRIPFPFVICHLSFVI